jgi:integrase
MKAKKEHRVPLSAQAIALLTTARERWPNATLVFPGRYGKQLSNMAMLMCMRRLKMSGTPHGLRSSFRDWCADRQGRQGQRVSARAGGGGARSHHRQQDRACLQAHGPFRAAALANAGVGHFATGKPAKPEAGEQPATGVRPAEMRAQ